MSYLEKFDQTRRLIFTDQAELAVNYYTSKLRPYVSEQDCEGERDALAQYYDSVKASREEGRAPKNVDNPANRRRRWIAYKPNWKSGEYIDDNDKFMGMQDYMSPLMEVHFGAVRRSIDEDVILEAMFADAYEGKLGSTPKSFLNSQIIKADRQEGAGTAAVGLNLRKLRDNRKLYAGHKYDLEKEPIMIAVTAEQIDDLGDEIKLQSTDYRNEAGPKFTREGKLEQVWSHQFIEYQNLQTKTADYGGQVTLQRVPTWLKSKVRLGIWKDVHALATPDSSREDTLYMRVKANMEATRLEETAVSEIECLID